MTKTQKELDRQAVLFDFKNRLIALVDNGQELPETGIYDEPVRYFKANLKWTPIIFGWLAILQSVAGWKDAEDETYRGIQELLIFEEGIEEPMATQEDIAKGMYQAINWLALQVATGSYQNVNLSSDADGVVTQPPTGGADAELPADDPATVNIDENKAAKYGGFLSVTYNLRAFLAYVDFLYGPVNGSPVTSAADAKALIGARYVVDASMDAAIDAYWAARATTSQITTLDREDLSDHLYCNQNNETENNVADFIANLSGFTTAQKLTCIGITNGIEETQWNIWYAGGTDTPSSEYKAAPCEPVDYEEFTLDMSTANNVQYTTNAVHKKEHRLKFEVSGSFVDSDVPDIVQDFFYSVNTSTGVKTFLPAQFQINGAGITEPSQAQVPYRADHSYSVTLDIPSTGSGTIQFGRDNDTFTIPNVTGILTLKVTDLGKYL